MSEAAVSDYLDAVMRAARAVDPAAVVAMIDVLERAYREERGVFVIGNGGSASNASHLAQDLSKGALPGFPDVARFRVLSLVDNIAFITAIANDINYDRVFELQLRQFARPGEVLVAISCSGNSPNILRALDTAEEIGLTVIGVTGHDGGALRARSTIALHVPVPDTCQAEAVHAILLHAVVDLLRDRLRRRGPPKDRDPDCA